MNYYCQSSLDFLYLPKGPKVDREKLEETQFNSKILDQNNIKHLYQKQLNNDTLFNYPIEFITELEDNLIIFLNNREENTLLIYKTDQELNIIKKTEIYFEVKGDHNIYRPKPKRSIVRYRNYVILLNKYFYKINLETFEIMSSQSSFVDYGGNNYRIFSIHKKNNCIYLPEIALGIRMIINVINIKTLNLIKKVTLIDCNSRFLNPPATTVWCAIKREKLIINIQFDHEAGYTVFMILDVDNKQIPENYDYKIFPFFIDAGYHIYDKYLYIDGSSLKYDIDKNNFLANNNNILNLKKIDGICHIGGYKEYYNSEINKNFYYFFEEDKINIINLDKHPLLQHIDYQINLDEQLSSKFEICIANNKLFIADNNNKKFLIYNLDLKK